MKKSIEPNVVRDYDSGISGQDLGDQMLLYYSVVRKTIPWPKKILLHV